jgi:hypothetical protein
MNVEKTTNPGHVAFCHGIAHQVKIYQPADRACSVIAGLLGLDFMGQARSPSAETDKMSVFLLRILG